MDIWEGKKGAETIRDKTGYLVASFPVGDGDQLMLVTNGGQLIRTKVDGIRIAGRSTQGVIVFDTAAGRARRLGRAAVRGRRGERRLINKPPLRPATIQTGRVAESALCCRPLI